MAIGYEEENGKKSIKNLVPKRYKLIITVLLKEPGLYYFLLCCKKPEADPFMVWVVETVLPWEIRKLALAIEEKDNQIQALEFTNEKYQQKMLRLNEETDDLIKNRHVPRRGYFNTVLYFIKKNSRETHPYYVIRCRYRHLEKYKKCLKLCYPNMEEAGRCDDPNAIHR